MCAVPPQFGNPTTKVNMTTRMYPLLNLAYPFQQSLRLPMMDLEQSPQNDKDCHAQPP